MDPDQVDAADDLADATAHASGCGCAGAGEESWARALLRRWWDLSRKAAIAGAAATAAPVVAPPIIILSIAGVALSVPFAACLASLAATDRLMAALLPPAPPPQPCYTYAYDLGGDGWEQEEFLDASGAPDDQEAPPVLGYRSRTGEDAIVEQKERFDSLPLSREPRLSEELVPLLANEEGDSAEGEFAIRKSGHELFVPKDGKQKDNDSAMEVDNEYITMEAPSPGDVSSVSQAPVFREEDSMLRRMEGAPAPVPAKESVQELFVSDNEKKTEDVKSTTTENESGKEMLSPGLDTMESSDLVQMLGDNDSTVQIDVEGEASVRKSGQDSHVSGSGDKTEQRKTSEDMPPREVNVSESSVPDDNTVQSTDMAPQDDRVSKSPVADDQSTADDVVTVDVVLEEVTSSVDPVTGEVVVVQVDIIARESESLPMSDLVAHDLQVVTRAGTADDRMEDIVKGIGNTNAEAVEHQSGGGASVLTMDDGEELMSSRSTPYASAISDDTTSVKDRPDLEHHHRTTDVEYKVMDTESKMTLLAEDKDIYTEEQLWEQVNTLRTITGYRAEPSLTLEGELAGLYIFVGVEPPHGSRGASNLPEINKKLRSLKSIIGVE